MSAGETSRVVTVLPTRTPQSSCEARADRWMRMTGVLPPPATGCTDVALMRRVRDALRGL